MAFNTNPGRQSFTATASQTDFDFNFKIFAETDIKVYQTPSGQTPDDTTDILTYASDYTVTIDGDNGGTVTLLTGATVDDTLVIVRDLPRTRTVSFVEGGDLEAATLNEDQDYQTYLIVDARAENERAIILPDTDTDMDRTLPSSEEHGYLRVKSDRSGFEYVSSALAITDKDTFVVPDIADMLLVSSSIGTVIVSDPIRGGVFEYDATQSSTNNGGTVFNGWVRQYSGPANVKWFGAKGDGTTNDAIPIQNALNATSNILVPNGTFLITSTITVTPPFSIKGEGSERSILLFKGMSGLDGIDIQQASNRSTNYITDMSIKIGGETGRYGITSPKGTSVFNTNTPTYILERLKFTGENETATEGLYDFGWEIYIDLGDGKGHVVRDVEIQGAYDYSLDPTTITTDSSIGVRMTGVSGEGGVLTPTVDHSFIHYVGTAVAFGYQVSNPFIVDSQFHRCYRGIYSPNTSVGGSYGVLEAQLSNLNINAQLTGIHIAQTAYLDINAVRVTRADGGFDHPDTWYGFNINNTDGLKINGSRGYVASTGYSNSAIGMNIANCDFVYISGYNAEENLTRGIIFEDSNRVTCVGATFKAPTTSSFYFKYIAIADPEITIINDKHTTATVTPYAYDGSILREGIEFIGGKTVYSSVADSITGITAVGGTTDISVASSSQVLYYQMNTSASTHAFNLLNAKAREGDVFKFRINVVSGFTGTVSITPNGGSAIWSKTGSGVAEADVVECVFTEATWKLLGSFLSTI